MAERQASLFVGDVYAIFLMPSDYRIAFVRLLCRCFCKLRGLEQRFSKRGAYHRIPPASGFQALIKRFVLRTVIAPTISDKSESYADFLPTLAAHFSWACVRVFEDIWLSCLIKLRAINRPEVCAPVHTTSRPDMFVRKCLSIALVILWSTVYVLCSYDPSYPCTKPTVRREWRAFSTEEKAEWIRAIEVSIDTSPHTDRLAEALTGF